MTVEVPVFPEQAAMHLRRYHVSCLHRLRQLPLFVLVFVLRIATVGAQYNVTVGASNAVLEYQPPDAWEKVTDQMLGDGTARITRKKGAWVALAFTGVPS